MSAHPLTDLTDGILAALLGSPVADQVPGGFVPQLPQDPTYPIVRVTTRGVPVGPINGSADWRCDVELDVYSHFRGDTECLAIADGLTQLLNQQPLAVAAWQVSLMSLLDLYTVEDEFVNEQMVSRWTLPFQVWMHAIPAPTVDLDPYRTAILADGAMSYWRLDESSGPTAADSVGDRDGVIDSLVTLAQDGVLSGNQGMRFSGLEASRITVPHGSFIELGTTASISIECWVRIVAIDVSDHVIFDTAPLDGHGPGFFLEAYNDGLFYWTPRTHLDAPIYVAGPGAYVIGQWHHLVSIIDRTTQQARFYQDAVEATAETLTAEMNFSAEPTADFVIGRANLYAMDEWRGFHGDIDEVAIYPHVLTPAQIAAHYALGSS